jgi:hypothetical protein
MALRLMLEHDEWMDTVILKPALDTWEVEKRPISRATTNEEFKNLARGVAHLFAVTVWERQDESFAEKKAAIEEAAGACARARVTAYIAGERAFARRKHQREQKRAIARRATYEPDVPASQTAVPATDRSR